MSFSQQILSIDELTEQAFEQYKVDTEFAAQVDHKIKANINALKMAAESAKIDPKNKPSGTPPKAGSSGVSRAAPLSSSKFSSVDSATLRAAMFSASAEKIRDLTPAEREVKFDGLCDFMSIAEEKPVRMAFYYSVIAWITLNTASTENSIDSVLYDGKSSLMMLDYFAHDIRPFARSLAYDAKQFISMVTSDRSHPMFEPFTAMARRYNVPKTPWLIYDGIDAMGLTGGEARIAAHIKQQRLASNVNYNTDAAVDRDLLSGKDTVKTK